MSEPKFTKGTWHVSENQPTVIGTTEKTVCKCELDWNLGANERKANAALIAAAPAMYVLLEDLLGKFRNDEFAPQIEAVLKKARCEE